MSEWQDLGWDWERNTIPTKELGSGLTHSGLTCKSRGISSRLQYTARQFCCRYSILSFLTCLCSKRGGKEDLGSCNRACTCAAATELQQRGLGSVSYNRAGTELQQSCNRAATAAIELQHLQQLVWLDWKPLLPINMASHHLVAMQIHYQYFVILTFGE